MAEVSERTKLVCSEMCHPKHVGVPVFISSCLALGRFLDDVPYDIEHPEKVPAQYEKWSKNYYSTSCPFLHLGGLGAHAIDGIT